MCIGSTGTAYNTRPRFATMSRRGSGWGMTAAFTEVYIMAWGLTATFTEVYIMAAWCLYFIN
jgi:hypothetical protein